MPFWAPRTHADSILTYVDYFRVGLPVSTRRQGEAGRSDGVGLRNWGAGLFRLWFPKPLLLLYLFFPKPTKFLLPDNRLNLPARLSSYSIPRWSARLGSPSRRGWAFRPRWSACAEGLF